MAINSNELIRLYNDGNSISKIARITGVCHNTVGRWLRKNGVMIEKRPLIRPKLPKISWDTKEERDKHIIELSKKYAGPSIANILSISKKAVYDFLKENDIIINKENWRISKKLDNNAIIESYISGQRVLNIANQHNISTQTVVNILHKNKISVRTRSNSLRIYHNSEDNKALSNIDPNSAYIAGLVASDGHVSRYGFNITLQYDDHILLESVRDYLNHGSIREFYIKSRYADRKPSHQCRLMVCNVFLKEQLCNLFRVLDFKLDKIESLDFLESYLKEFMLGYFDGDGVLGRKNKRHTGYVGPLHVMELFANVIEPIIGHRINVLKHGSIFRIKIGGHETSIFLDWLYQAKCKFRLARKFELYKLKYGAAYVKFLNGNRFSVDRSIYKNKVDLTTIRETILNRISHDFIAPEYTNDELSNDLKRCRDEDCSSYGGDIIRSTVPNWHGMAGRKIMLHFNKHFWNVKVRGRKTIPEIWDRDVLSNCLDISMSEMESLSLERIFREMFFHHRCARTSLFAPGFARFIYRHFLGNCSDKLLFDPCAGWAGRLIGAYVENMQYIGCELSEHTNNGLCNISSFLKYDSKIYNNSCLNIIWPKSDLIFTSPPYHNNEFYIGGDQPGSWCKEKWLEQFIRPFVNKINGLCALYVNEQTMSDFSYVRHPDKILNVQNRKHPRRKDGHEYIIVYL